MLQRYHISPIPPYHRGTPEPPFLRYTFFFSFVRDTPTAFSKERRRNEQKKEEFCQSNGYMRWRKTWRRTDFWIPIESRQRKCRCAIAGAGVFERKPRLEGPGLA